MALLIILFKLIFLITTVSSKVTLRNPDFESPPTNITTNSSSTSQSVLLDPKTNVIPGWSFKGTVWYVTAGGNGNISLPGNGHGVQLGPNGVINQTFKTDGSYDYVVTFTLAPSSVDCADNSTAVNVSGPGVSKVFVYKESVGNELWQSYGYSIGSDEIRKGVTGIQIRSVANYSNRECWPIVDTLRVTGVEVPSIYSDTSFGIWIDRGFVNSGFEIGPVFLDNSSEGILLEADTSNEPLELLKSPLQEWTILGIVKYIDSKHFTVPRGRAAVMLLSGNPSGILYNQFFLKRGKVTLDFIMGDANDSCVGDFTVFLQVKNMIWNFTMTSLGNGSSVKHSVTFKAEFSNIESVPISFASFNETRTRDKVLCGPVIDSPTIRFSCGLRSKRLHNGPVIFCFIMVVTFLFLS